MMVTGVDQSHFSEQMELSLNCHYKSFVWMEEESSVWEDLSAEFCYSNQEEAFQLVQILDSAKIERFKAQIFFKEQYQKVDFMNQYRIQTQGISDDNKRDKRNHKNFLRPPEGYPNFFSMELGKEDLRGKIFIHVFREEISQIEVQNNYKIFSDRNRLRIFMKEGSELNMLCKNKLFSLKEQLNVLNSYDRGVIVKISNSELLKEMLEKEGITSWFKVYRSREVGFFFSKKLLLGEIQKKLYEIAEYSISLMAFRQRSFQKKVNEAIFSLIKESISEQVESLREQWQIDVQFNSFKHCLVIHKKHECFGRQLESELKKTIDNLVIFSIQSEEIRTFCNAIRRQMDSMPFLKEKMKQSRNETFMVVNRAKLMPMGPDECKSLETFLKFLKIAVDSTLTIRVYFYHIDANFKSKQIKRVLQLAEDNNLFLKNDVMNDKYQTHGVWTLKSYSETIQAKRQREFLQFIKTLILKDQSNTEEISSMIDSFFEEESGQHSVSSVKPAASVEKSKYEEMGKIEWYTEKLEPKRIQIEQDDKPFIYSGRRRDLEKLFELNTRKQFKLWNLALDCKIDWPTQVESVPFCIRNGFMKKQFNEKFEPIDPSSLKVGEKAIVVFMSKSLSLNFLPVLQIERVG